MTILLQWLVEHAWIFYVVCAIGVIIYVVRALAARRERSLALFTLERETATARIVQSWAMAFVFVAIGGIIYASATFVLPSLPADRPGTHRPTSTPSAGVQLTTPQVATTPSPTLGFLVPTLTSTDTTAPTVLAPTVPLLEPTESPAPAPTDTPEPAISGEIRARFGNFAELVSYSVPGTQVTTAQGLPLTLRWQALEGASPMNYIVFTHLLAEDGHLIAQHDGVPVNGTRPLTEWTTGEVIVDLHTMVFQDTGYVGSATIAVGLYDLATGRVPTQTGSDFVVLPTTIAVVAQ
jgi:hypothetical protein